MNLTIEYVAPFVLNLLRYFIIAGFAFVLFYKFFPKTFANNKIQARLAKGKDFLREIRQSMQTTVIISLIAILFLKSPIKEYTAIYKDIADYPLWWIPVSTLIALIVHDAYFYWMHRLIHHPKLFKHVHLVHHQSTNPSPWTSYSFHFLEAILEALIAPIIFFLLPMHPLAILTICFYRFYGECIRSFGI